MIARTVLYVFFIAIAALLVLYATGPIRGNSGPVRVADRSEGPVPVSPRPSPSHEPFVAPAPFVHPLRSTTLTALQTLLQAHDPEAQCEMGLRLSDGVGMPKDPQSARLLFEIAARQNNGCAISNLGNLAYEQGDYDTAAQYYHKAAALGYPVAFNNLGSVARYGPQHDEVEAYKWYREAAQRGYTPADDLVGTGYITGRYGPPDKWLAFQWYQLGAAGGDQDAIRDVAWFYTYQSDDPDRYKKAIAWLKKAPCKCSDYEIGRLYLKGLGVPADVYEAARYFKRAADEEYAPAQTAYANLLREGQLGSPNPTAALAYYRGAAIQGDGEAMDAIAHMTEQGIAVTRDPASAEMMYVAAAAHCSADALLRLAKISATGSPSRPKDIDEAVALAELSLMCGGDPALTEPILRRLSESGKLDAARSNQLLKQLMSTIHDNTGNPNFVPTSPLPPISEGAKTST